MTTGIQAVHTSFADIWVEEHQKEVDVVAVAVFMANCNLIITELCEVRKSHDCWYHKEMRRVKKPDGAESNPCVGAMSSVLGMSPSSKKIIYHC